MSKRNVALGVLLLLSAWGRSDAANERGAVEDLTVTKTPDYIEFTITSTAEVRYTHFKLDGPRLVVDFHDAENHLSFSEQTVGVAGVDRVRAAFFRDENREATRVVFDLSSDVPYSVSKTGEGQIKIRFEGESAGTVAAELSDGPESEIATDERAESAWAPPKALIPFEQVAFDAPQVPEAAWQDVPVSAGQAPAREPEVRSSSVFPDIEVQPETSELTVALEAIGAAPPAPIDPVLVANLEAPVLPLSVQGPIEPVGPERANPEGEPAAAPVTPAALTAVPIAPARPTATPLTFLGQQVAAVTQLYTGEIYSFDFRGVDIRDFFRTIGEISGLNIVLAPGVAGEVNLYLIDVPWDQALDVVFETHGLGYELEGNVMRVATRATLQAEEDELTALREAQELNAPQETRTYTLSYTQASDAAPIVTSVLSERGNIITSAEHNALIITDISRYFDRVESLIGFLDTPQQQVEIEARLLSASKTFARDLGNQLGLIVNNNSGSNVLTGIPGDGSPFERLTTPPPAVTTGDGGIPLVADFPVAGRAGLSVLLGLANDVILDEIIQVAETRGTAKLLSRPRVVTQNNQVAHVEQGTQIPVQTSVNNTITVEYIPFSLSLDVTPRITEEGTILLSAEIENSTPDFAREVQGRPSVATQRASTSVLIPDGGTAVVGGILVDIDTVSVSQVPGLGNIPLLGHLFKSTSTVKDTTELLFFITARIKPMDPLEFLTETGDEQSFLVPELGGGSSLDPALPDQLLLGADGR